MTRKGAGPRIMGKPTVSGTKSPAAAGATAAMLKPQQHYTAKQLQNNNNTSSAATATATSFKQKNKDKVKKLTFDWARCVLEVLSRPGSLWMRRVPAQGKEHCVAFSRRGLEQRRNE